MERKIEIFFKKWKKEGQKKPLIIYGPKQIGKTFSVLKFAKAEYKNYCYFNTDNNHEIIELFKKEKSQEKIIMNLSMISGETILEEDTLIIFDNLSNIDIVKGLKLFSNEKNKYHIISITTRRSLLKEFKAEELQFKGMNELDFEEYLIAHDEKELAELIKESYTKRKTCPFHKLALDLFHKYLITGGMPEVIQAELNGYDEYQMDAIKQKILDVYKKEVIYNKALIDIPRSSEVLDSVPEQLKKKNKKFQYGTIKQGTRKKEYETSIEYLVDNQLLYRSYKISNVKSPLTSCREKDSFKLFIPDDGLLFTMLHLNYKKFLLDENLKEIIYENHIAKTLTEAGYSLFYYQSEGKAELNFVVQDRMGVIIPIELTIKKDAKAKSLSVFMSKFTVPQGIRVTENNFQTKKDIRYIPIYAMFTLNEVK